MYTITRNVAYDHYRKNNKPHDNINDYENCLSAQVDVEKDLTDLEQMDLLNQALNALKYSQKEVLILSCYKQLKYKQIAEILKVSEGAVKMKIKRALI